MQNIIAEARKYIDLGLPIIPICSHDHKNMTDTHIERCKCAGKTPLIKGWQEHNITTEADLQSWLKSFKTFNIGLPGGDASGFVFIDVDGDEGVDLLMKMSEGELPATWEFSTGAGQRLLYLIPDGMKTKKFKQTGDGKHQECALMCTGQQTVLPPSIHYTGTQYNWVEGHDPWSMDCAIAPDWLLKLIEAETTTINVKPNSGSITIDLNTGQKTSYTMDLDDEFSEAEFVDELPEDIVVKQKNVRSQGKSGHKIVITEELLTQSIPEGSRDNTMTAIVGHYCANRDLRRLGKEFIMSICLKHNQDYCIPPLDENVVQDKVNYFYEAEQIKDEEYKKKEKTTFEASKMAKNVLQYLYNGGVQLHFDQYSKWYYYTTLDKGPWKTVKNVDLIRKWIREVITSAHYGDPLWDKRSYIEETKAAIEEAFATGYKDTDDFDLGAHAKDLCDYIVVNDGMLDWRSGTILPWDPTYKTTIAFNLDYIPEAKCPRFEKYLQEWLPSEAVRCVLQEYLGYCLIPLATYRKALFLYGKGKNGKSMLLEFLQDFFGIYSSSLSYDGLFTRFGPADLKDKLVNVFDDTSVSFTKETSIVKNLIAGGTITAEHKGTNAFQFRNVARFIYSSQETPKTTDVTIAWYDRWFFVKFPNQFRASNAMATEIKNALKEEKSGIFNWMIAGLKRLMEQDGFTNSSDLDLTSMEYRSQNNSVTQFVYNVCTTVKEKQRDMYDFNVGGLYEIYKIWAENENLRPVGKKSFITRLDDMGYATGKGKVAGKIGTQKVFTTLTINEASEDFEDIRFEVNIALGLKY